MLLAMALVFALLIFFSMISVTNGKFAEEIVVLLVVGSVSGGLVRGFVREKLVTVVFALVVLGECVLLSQFPEPWSLLWLVLIPANAIGVMVGNVAREGLRESSRPEVTRDVWVVNGVEVPPTDRAKKEALVALASWDSATSGRFFVARNDGVFEAMGSPVTGFIVHCAADFREESEWRILGSFDGKQETEIRIPSGPAYAPSWVVVDLETAIAALQGFFHYRGPNPELLWTSGEEVLDLKFG